MERILEKTLLYDFYGELLTDQQKRVYEAFVLEDMSESEIGRDQGISRQGVHDMMKRCNKKLEEYERKLQLVAKFVKTQERVAKINRCAKEILEQNQSSQLASSIEEIENISNEILEDF